MDHYYSRNFTSPTIENYLRTGDDPMNFSTPYKPDPPRTYAPLRSKNFLIS